jgi:hypothetical protein
MADPFHRWTEDSLASGVGGDEWASGVAAGSAGGRGRDQAVLVVDAAAVRTFTFRGRGVAYHRNLTRTVEPMARSALTAALPFAGQRTMKRIRRKRPGLMAPIFRTFIFVSQPLKSTRGRFLRVTSTTRSQSRGASLAP